MSVKKFSASASGEVSLSANFKVKEFKCKDGTDEVLIDVDFVKNKLQNIRDHFGKPISITSGYRTQYWNTKVGGAKSSYHMKGQAFDIKVQDTALLDVAKYAESIGVLGIIVYPGSGFVHVDSRTSRYYSKDSGKSSCTTFGGTKSTAALQNTSAVSITSKSAKFNQNIYDLQGALNDDGFTDKDGNKLKQDGEWGPKTASAAAKVLLSEKTYGKYVNVTAWVQCRVDANIDGKYGSETAEKVGTFQKSRNITVDRKTGKTTMLELVRVYVPDASY